MKASLVFVQQNVFPERSRLAPGSLYLPGGGAQ
jgi:hypothetical protein